MTELLDETLRDGLQSPSVVHPTLADKLALLERIAAAGIDAVNIGYPAASARLLADTIALARHAGGERLGVALTCAARTLVADVVPIARAAHRSGQPIEACLFIASSPIRLWTEGWDRRVLLDRTVAAIDFAIAEGLDVAYVAEDTTRSAPELLDDLFRAAIEHGARRLVLCDTVGHATPDGARALVGWTRALVRASGVDVKIDWHGHDDRGLALANSLRAVEAGADRVHGCAFGLGERVGNAPMELLLLNLRSPTEGLDGALAAYVRAAAVATGVPIPRGHPLERRPAPGAAHPPPCALAHHAAT